MVLADRMLAYQQMNADRIAEGKEPIPMTPLFNSPGEMVTGLFFGAAGFALFGIVFSAITIALQAGYTGFTTLMLLRPYGVPVYVSLAVGTGCFVFMAMIWLLRDYKSWSLVAWAQIFVSVAACLVIISAQQFSPTAVVGILAACFSGSTGFKRLMEIRAAKKVVA